MTIPTERAEAAKERAVADLMGRPGVIGVGVTAKDGQAAILILVQRLTAELSAGLPKQIEDFPVVIEEVGEVKAH